MDTKQALYTFGTGENFHLQHYLGAHKEQVDGVEGYSFRVWAPNAQAVHLVGDFTQWEENEIPMVRNEAGVWEVFTTAPQVGDIYKFHVTRQNGHRLMKVDPLAVRMEKRPGTGAVITDIPERKWKDGLWMARRRKLGFRSRPVNIYEVHAGSWKRNEDGSPYSFAQLKEDLIPYLVKMNYTHVEFMPVMAHPLGLSWGYQLMGYFALEHTYGTPEEFQDFVEACHLNNIGVIVDWVPGHFTINDDALAYYDGTPTFEYQDHHRAHNYGWGALNFDLGKNQVQSFLISSVKFWIEFYHLDGIRVDAVSNMLYLDYDSGPWTPNIDGGNLNYEGIHFLKRMNAVIKSEHPDVIMVAEESSSGTKITGPEEYGGLGFDYKWNMGWMNDSLSYIKTDPYFRKYEHQKLTFPMIYAYSENYILPISHDEVVYGKGSLLNKMPGDYNQKFAGLRGFLMYMLSHPGKKLTFMGCELGEFDEWNFTKELDWNLLDFESHRKLHDFVRDANHFYLEHKALWEIEDDWSGFEWINPDDADHNIISYKRRAKSGREIIFVINFSPVTRENYYIGVDKKKPYKEIFNTDDVKYGGSGILNEGKLTAKKGEVNGKEQYISITVPSLAAVVIV